MNDVLITGTVALDTIQTPFGKVDRALGGSASYAAVSASFFARPSIVSIIGKDFPNEYIDLLRKRNVDLSGIKTMGKTFHWEGFYEFDMNEAKTQKTELNSLQDFVPEVSKDQQNIKYIFLANIGPDHQLEVLSKIKKPEFVVLDTMNFWISSKKSKLLEVTRKANLLLLNEGEARQLFNTVSLVKAAHDALLLGPSAVIIKKGEHGALLFTKDNHFSAPSYPLETIKDPTGCGDCFGGGVIGYLAKTKKIDEASLRKAIIYGSVLASFNAEDFGLNRLNSISMKDIEARYKEFEDIRSF